MLCELSPALLEELVLLCVFGALNKPSLLAQQINISFSFVIFTGIVGAQYAMITVQMFCMSVRVQW